MAKFPIKFEAEAKASPGILSSWSVRAGSLPDIPCAIPSEFAGPGAAYSPEDLFGLSLLSCFIALFKIYCEKGAISFKELRGKVVITMDQNISEHITFFSHANIYIDIEGSSDQEKVRSALDRAVKECPVGNSIKTGKTFLFNVK